MRRRDRADPRPAGIDEICGCQHPEDDHDEAGCTHTSVERGRLVGSTIPHWPSILDGLRFRWSAADGIDLTTGIAVPVRAYVESHKLIEKTYTMQAGYPGFDRAVLGPQCANSRTGHDSDLQRP